MTPERKYEIAKTLHADEKSTSCAATVEEADFADDVRNYYDRQDCTCEEFGGDWGCWYRLTDEEQIQRAVLYA